MFGLPEKNLPSEWQAELRGRTLTLEDAKALSLFEVASQTHALMMALEEIKLRLVEIDKTMERTVPGHRQADVSHLRALREGN